VIGIRLLLAHSNVLFSLLLPQRGWRRGERRYTTHQDRAQRLDRV